MNKEKLINELTKLGIKLSESQLKLIDDFCLLLLEENKKYNLTSIREYNDVLLKHVYDSLTLIKVHDLTKNQALLDIGSGAGFPGVILKIAFPNLKITLLDSNGKKTRFLELAKKELNLKNLNIIKGRAEEYIKDNRESFDLVTARAVASLNILIELAIPYLKINGLFIAMKSDISEEIKLAKEACSHLNSEIELIQELLLPIEKSNRTLVIVKKTSKTPISYPRRYDQIIKKPLKIIVK